MTLIPIRDAADIGTLARDLRRQQGLRQDDLAAIIGASHVFLRDVEQGKGTVQLGKLLRLLDELGVRIHLEVPDSLDGQSA
ncbi:helix-turn-helix transcriptional regulator [Aquipseudomonas campi]|uniref:Helix-turn-helix transcriptional regulator n=1 Tax=Aquipseudomonas campi TaxID=2731681 RepID=A0A6M8FG68_9GAMM|nr:MULTISPECIES: helix-turn-helix domain-containing protein [Pseudomonas]QKE63272.1 helix-turn-helix transcriptional regulator [Pseudomonas campi]UUY07392.1 helix-turn-helix domain-containing protein [Pseudomonas sp. J452]